jgi:hypothetical protein
MSKSYRFDGEFSQSKRPIRSNKKSTAAMGLAAIYAFGEGSAKVGQQLRFMRRKAFRA